MNSSVNNDALSERRGAVLNREERRNAITLEVLGGISQGLTRVETDRSIRLIVLTGAGEKAFCAGADLQSGRMFDPDPSEPTSGSRSYLGRHTKPRLRSSLVSTAPAWPGRYGPAGHV
jgi:enoyl-CoA hydratase/carnithine racemase